MALLSLNKPLSFTALACFSILSLAPVQAASIEQGKLNRVERELKIMSNILRTSLTEETKSRPSIDSVYLAQQGMLFTIQQRNGFHFELRELPRLPEMPPAPPVPELGSLSIEFTQEQIEQIEEHAIRAAESAVEVAEMSIDYMSDADWSSYSASERSVQKAQQVQMRSEKRELENQARKLEREVRNIERKLRDSEFSEQIERAEKDSKRTEALKKEMDKLTKSLSGVADKLKASSLKLQKKAEEVKLEQEKKIKARLALTEKVISESVCDFGPGLRALNKDQHISFRIEGKKNRMYIFEMADIQKCGDGKFTASKLLEKATKYTL